MFFTANTLDDLMLPVMKELLKRPFNVHEKKTSEIIGAMLHLNNPRARISRSETKGKPFSALGELLWYLSKDKKLDFISYYISAYKVESDDGKTIYGGYGPRLFKLRKQINQIESVISLLKKRPSTRQAVIQIFDGEDLKVEHNNIPCTCTIQLLLRKNKLNMFTSMRSNDAFLGLPHDIFAFTMLQEIIARALGVELGIYTHAAGSLHLYRKDISKAKQYVKEGFQSTKEMMPKMPKGDPWPALKTLLDSEKKIRLGKHLEVSNTLNVYWKDLINLLLIYNAFKKRNSASVGKLKEKIHYSVYHTYIDQKIQFLKKKTK